MLSNDQAGQLIKALLCYCDTGERLASNDNVLIMAFSFISAQIDRDTEKYALACEKRSKYMKDKWKKEKSTIVDYSRPGDNDNEGENDNENENVNDNEGEGENDNENDINNRIGARGEHSSPSPPQKRFKKPSLEAVKTYCNERGNVISAEKFYEYYESNGWKVGRTKMKDWKAAIRKWELTEYDDRSKTSTEPELTKGEDGFYYDKNGDRYI